VCIVTTVKQKNINDKACALAPLVLNQATIKTAERNMYSTVRAGHLERYQLQSYRFKPLFGTLYSYRS
jgi:hypothetical protein